MRRVLAVVGLVLVAACGGYSVAEAGATGGTWPDSHDDSGVRVIQVDGHQCIEVRETHGGGVSSNPVTASVGLSCDWSPK